MTWCLSLNKWLACDSIYRAGTRDPIWRAPATLSISQESDTSMCLPARTESGACGLLGSTQRSCHHQSKSDTVILLQALWMSHQWSPALGSKAEHRHRPPHPACLMPAAAHSQQQNHLLLLPGQQPSAGLTLSTVHGSAHLPSHHVREGLLSSPLSMLSLNTLRHREVEKLAPGLKASGGGPKHPALGSDLLAQTFVVHRVTESQSFNQP